MLALLDIPYLSLFVCLSSSCSSALIMGAFSTTPNGANKRTAFVVWLLMKQPHSEPSFCFLSDIRKSASVRMSELRARASLSQRREQCFWTIHHCANTFSSFTMGSTGGSPPTFSIGHIRPTPTPKGRATGDSGNQLPRANAPEVGTSRPMARRPHHRGPRGY